MYNVFEFSRKLYSKMATLALIALAALSLNTPLAHAMTVVDHIVAVVNDDIITANQLDDRLSFAMKNISGTLTKPQKKELLESQLKELIEEELILQYAEDKSYTVTEAQIQQAIANLEQNNKKPGGSFLEFAGDQKDSAIRSIKTSILTQMIKDRELQQRVNVSDREVARIVDGIISRQGENVELELAQIFLPVDDSEEETEVKKTIQRLHQQLREGKTGFSNMARAYSRDRSAKEGGLLGWFRLGELVPTIEEAVKGLGKGDLSAPTRTANGWHIFKVLDQRKPEMPDMSDITELRLLQLYAPIDSTAGTPAPLQNKKHQERFTKLASGIDSAEEFEKMVEAQKEESPLYIASGDMGWVDISGMQSKLQNALKDSDAGDKIGPVSTDEGTYLFYVTDKRQQSSKALQGIRERVRERLLSRQTDLEMRRLIRNLRRRAFIEIRL